MHCEPVGFARTPFETTDDAPMQGEFGDAEGRIEIDDEYAPALAGWDGDRVVVVWVADRADRSTLTHERDGETRGVFTTRSPHRPNPVLLTTCAVLAVEDATLHVRGVDMLDGSPVLDLKPPLD
jgi:tRNA-Thr(GGU) m(6)t(6)A37 methyltransferase TsaA